MTIRFLKPWNGYQPDAVVSGLTNEAVLIAGGLASDDLDGGNDGRTYEAKLAADANGNVTGLAGRDGKIVISANQKRKLNNTPNAYTLLTDFSTGTLAYNGGAAADSARLFLGSNTQKIPHNATPGAARFDWTHVSSWTQGHVYGFWYQNTRTSVLNVDVLVSTTGFSNYKLTTVALEPTGTGWKYVTFGQKTGQTVGTVTISSTALNIIRVRECLNAPWSTGDFVNIGPIYQSGTRRAFAMIHFDDCNQNVYTNGLPITSDYDIPCTVNVITSLIGKTYLGNQTFTAAQLRDVYENHNWAVCNHTRTHPNVQSTATAPISVVDNGDGTATVTVTTDGNGNPGHGLVSSTNNPNGVQVVMAGFTPSNFNKGGATATILSATQFSYGITSGSGPVTVMGTWNPGYTQHGLGNLATYAEKLSEIEGGITDLLALGFTKTAHYLAYPQGGYDVETIQACAEAGVKLARGTYETVFWPADVVSGLSLEYGTIFTQTNTPFIPPYQAGIDVPAAQPIDTRSSWAAVKAEIDIAVATGGCWVGLTHSISGTRGTAGSTAYMLETVCQYLHLLRSQGLIDVGTMHDYYERLTANLE